jgi:hypothetical protein
MSRRLAPAALALASALALAACGADEPPLPPNVEGLSTAPYVLDLGCDHATLCWVTAAEAPTRLELTGPRGTRARGDGASRRFHRVALTDLAPGTHYRYAVGGVHEATFRTLDDREAFRFAVFGHAAGTETLREYPTGPLAAALDDFDVDFALCTGDITYYTSVEGFARHFLHAFRRFLARAPIFVAPGNHDGGFPQRAGFDYTALRTVFPRDYSAPDELASYTFVHQHVRFVALTYCPDRQGAFDRQLDWLRAVLTANTTEFTVVFFGGANPPARGYDEDALNALLAEHGVDAVFRHDGSGVYQRTLEGVPHFHIGTSGAGVRQFHLVDVRPYELRVRQADTRRTFRDDVWVLGTQRPKTVTRTVEGGTREDRPGAARLVHTGLDEPSDGFDGVRVTLDWPHEQQGVLQVLWAPTGVRNALGRGDGALNRCRLLRMDAPGEHTFLVDLPAVDPLTGEPYVLEHLVLRIDTPPGMEPVPIEALVRAVSLVRNG